MEDLTIIYYTANMISGFFEKNIIDHLKGVVGDTKIISVSWKPMDLGENIVFEGVRPSVYYIYKQILMGAERATTKYIACAEDDTLYTKEHFAFRPPDDTFAYNEGHLEMRWGTFIKRGKRNMSTCIVNRELLIDTLRKRYEKFPDFLDSKKGETGGHGEPGRSEHRLGLPIVKIMGFSTNPAPLVFWHRPSMGGIRALKVADIVFPDEPYWGNGKELYDKMYKKP